jgi:hypothetical protein
LETERLVTDSPVHFTEMFDVEKMALIAANSKQASRLQTKKKRKEITKNTAEI